MIGIVNFNKTIIFERAVMPLRKLSRYHVGGQPALSSFAHNYFIMLANSTSDRRMFHANVLIRKADESLMPPIPHFDSEKPLFYQSKEHERLEHQLDVSAAADEETTDIPISQGCCMSCSNCRYGSALDP